MRPNFNYKDTNFRDHITINERAAIFLTKLGRGLTHRDIALIFGIAESTSRKIVNEVSEIVLSWIE